eukprot:3933071-Rhodomonas_salina.2
MASSESASLRPKSHDSSVQEPRLFSPNSHASSVRTATRCARKPTASTASPEKSRARHQSRQLSSVPSLGSRV